MPGGGSRVSCSGPPGALEDLRERREQLALEQYYEASRILRMHLRGGSYIVRAASISPTTLKVKTL